MFALGVIAGNFFVEMNSLPFLQGTEDVSHEESQHNRRHSALISNRIACHIICEKHRQV